MIGMVRTDSQPGPFRNRSARSEAGFKLCRTVRFHPCEDRPQLLYSTDSSRSFPGTLQGQLHAPSAFVVERASRISHPSEDVSSRYPLASRAVANETCPGTSCRIDSQISIMWFMLAVLLRPLGTAVHQLLAPRHCPRSVRSRLTLPTAYCPSSPQGPFWSLQTV